MRMSFPTAEMAGAPRVNKSLRMNLLLVELISTQRVKSVHSNERSEWQNCRRCTRQLVLEDVENVIENLQCSARPGNFITIAARSPALAAVRAAWR